MSNTHTISKLFLKKTNRNPHKKAIGYIENQELHFLNNNEYRDIVKKIFYSLNSLDLNSNPFGAISLFKFIIQSPSQN